MATEVIFWCLELVDRENEHMRIPWHMAERSFLLVRYLPGPPECEICYSSPKLVAIDGCGHDMCGECASELCRKGNVAPPTCPFCRHMIGGFHFVTLS